MKKRTKPKKILVKRINLNKQTYDYITLDESQAISVIESNKNNTTGNRYEKANWFVRSLRLSKKILANKHVEKIIYIILTFALTWFLKDAFDKWVC